MLVAYLYLPDESLQTFSTIDELKAHWPRPDVVLWADLEDPSKEELLAVGELFQLDQEALDDCMHGEQRPRIDDFDEYFFLMLYGMMGMESTTDIVPRKLAAFCGSHFLITVHRDTIRTATELHKRCTKLGSKLLQRGIPYVLFSLIDGMVDKYTLLVEKYESRLEELEDFSLDANVDESILEDMSHFRRDILYMRRVAFAQRELIKPLARGEHEYLSESLEHRFRHIQDHLTHVIERIDVIRERSRIVRENYNATLALRMNTIMKVLTVFSAVLLPLTFIASIYGMNFDRSLWPPGNHPASFIGILITMALLAAGLLLFFRWRRWL